LKLLTWRLAYRNLFRHKNRLLLNLSLLVGAFSAIVLFKGFKEHVLITMKNAKIETQYGHLEIAKHSYWSNLSVDQVTDRMVPEPTELIAKINKLPEINFVSSRIGFYGLVNTEEKSIAARFVGFDPTVESKMQSHVLFTEGKPFKDPRTIAIGSGLAKLLKVKAGDDVTIVSPTLQGGINAMDLHVTGLFSTGWTDIDNGTIFISLKDAQKVLDTDYVDQLLIKLNDEDQIKDVKSKLLALLPSKDLEIKTWRDLADLYVQVENFYDFQNVVIEFILLALLILSVSNTTNMIIFERLGEIGTLRALGDYETDIQKLFLLESIFLGVLAIVIAIPISYLLMRGLSSLNIPLVLPFTSRALPMKMIPLFGAYVEASLVCFFSIVVASIWPARKGSHVSVVNALRAKI
jgi:putative ABC transport system permease protein